jgi:hypothetical protein
MLATLRKAGQTTAKMSPMTDKVAQNRHGGGEVKAVGTISQSDLNEILCCLPVVEPFSRGLTESATLDNEVNSLEYPVV